MRSIPLSAVLLTTLGLGPLPAQTLHPEDRVRLDGLTASVVSHQGDTLYVQYDRSSDRYSPMTGSPYAGPFHYAGVTTPVFIRDVGKIELLRGRRAARKEAAGVGGLVGFVVGMVIGGGLNGPSDCGRGWFSEFCELEESLKDVGNGFLVGAVVGLVGAAMGSRVGGLIEVDNWEVVDLPEARLVLLPFRLGMGAGFSISF